MDSLALWKRNIDKKFEGLEECMICFSVIHGSNLALPKLACKTCKKRFHSACLVSFTHCSSYQKDIKINVNCLDCHFINDFSTISELRALYVIKSISLLYNLLFCHDKPCSGMARQLIILLL